MTFAMATFFAYDGCTVIKILIGVCCVFKGAQEREGAIAPEIFYRCPNK